MLINWGIESLRIALGLLLLIAAAGKVSNHRRFCQIVSALTHTSSAVAPFVAVIVVVIEVVTGVWLLSGAQSHLSGLVAAGIFATFGGVLSANLWLGDTATSCGCFGGTGQISRSLVVRNLILAALGIIVGRHSVSWIVLMSILATAAAVGLIITLRKTVPPAQASAVR